ncbi:MAG TPA: fumarylacetoacetate hydrolase family protein, partial [Gemmataceae bacterium]|nr:fumarylacetoacetate hydrolase family protein [Gemmataceae bacterium]
MISVFGKASLTCRKYNFLMKLIRSTDGWWAERNSSFACLDGFNLDNWLALPDPVGSLGKLPTGPARSDAPSALLPMGTQEAWAAGVTYLRSKTARMEESAQAASLYDRVYDAPRPELFYKANPARCAGPGEALRLRSDTKWIVPEPELTLVISSTKQVVGFTIGNDVSCRDIEGENTLYLPQAKMWHKCCSIGPAILVNDGTFDIRQSSIGLVIRRQGQAVFTGNTGIERIKRSFEELVSWLFRDQVFANGVFLLTGTGIVPADDFSLQAGDEVEIEVAEIGKLVNKIEA